MKAFKSHVIKSSLMSASHKVYPRPSNCSLQPSIHLCSSPCARIAFLLILLKHYVHLQKKTTQNQKPTHTKPPNMFFFNYFFFLLMSGQQVQIFLWWEMMGFVRLHGVQKTMPKLFLLRVQTFNVFAGLSLRFL